MIRGEAPAGPHPGGAAGADADVLRWRREFPILTARTYLNSCSLGALSRRAEAYLDDFRARWHTLGASAWYGPWLERIEELRGATARFLGADVAEMALLPSTSAALSVVAESLDYGARPRIVTTELDFPTLVYQWAVKPGVEVVVLRSDDGVTVPLERFAEAVDERTAAVATSHVFFATGAVQDVAAVGRIARSAGALSIVDGYQAAGQIPVDAHELGVDVYTAGPLKWLCGGPGLAYLYVRDALVRELRPRITSWFATEGQFDFDPEGFRYRDDARRFELGTPALPTVHAALGGQEIVDEVGIDAIHARNRALVARLTAGLEEEGFAVRAAPDPERRSAIVMVRHEDPPGAVAFLADRGVIVDARPGHVRVSPHFYNTLDEMDVLVGGLVAHRSRP